MENLKEALTTAPVLAHPDMDKAFILHTDASDLGLGAVLSQIQDDGKEHPIAYAARALKPYEKNYVTHDKECLAIKFGIEHFRHYLYGGPKFSIVTDHSALRWLMTSPPKNSRLARWRLEMDEYDFTITHRSGKENANADGLSRSPLFRDIAGPRPNIVAQSRIESLPLENEEAREVVNFVNYVIKMNNAQKRTLAAITP